MFRLRWIRSSLEPSSPKIVSFGPPAAFVLHWSSTPHPKSPIARLAHNPRLPVLFEELTYIVVLVLIVLLVPERLPPLL